MEFGSYGVRIDNQIIKMQIWDTAGQESYKSVTRIFYRGAHCVFLAYDMTREETFLNLIEWHKEIKQHAAQDVQVYLIGNKSELTEQCEVQFEQALEFARKNGIHKCFETSAKTGKTVEEVFSCASKDLYFKMMADLKANIPTPTGRGTTTPLSRNPKAQDFNENGGVKEKGCC